MLLPKKSTHPEDESTLPVKSSELERLEVDTFDDQLHIEWDPDASVTPIGQLPFFIHYLKLGHRFEPWVEDCLERRKQQRTRQGGYIRLFVVIDLIRPQPLFASDHIDV